MSSPAGSRQRAFGLVAMGLVALVGVTVASLAGYSALKGEETPPAAVRPGGASDTTVQAQAPASGLTAAQVATIATLKSQVSEIRGLEWKADLPIRIVSKAELASRVRDLTAEDRAEHADDVEDAAATLKLVGLFPQDLDYVRTIDELLSGNVLGFYDDESKELFVGGDPGQELSVATRGIVVHELVHALTDQHFDFGARTKALDEADRTEESFAYAALLEGDAEVVSALWAERHLTDSERRQMTEGGSADSDTLAKSPRYLLNSLYFPYVQGSEFVLNLFRGGGFAAVDDAYRRPPLSTEDIIHPASFKPGPGPTPPALPDLSSLSGCQLRRTGTLGEFDMAELLDLHLSSAASQRASSGWNGDTYALVRCGSAVGLVDRWATDSPTDVDELVAALSRWAASWTGGAGPDADGRFAGPGRVGRLGRSEGRVELVLAEDQATADRLSAALSQTGPASPANPAA